MEPIVFKGHEYTRADRAGHQGKCPHCGENAPDGSFWQASDKAFIGHKKVNNIRSIFCFECPRCFEKFFYHQFNDEVIEIMKNLKGGE